MFWLTYLQVIFCDHWYPCFGFLVMSPLGFKVGSALLVLQRKCNVHSVRCTSGVTQYQPLGGQHCGATD